jgi:short-subunit dehydrogenase
LAGQNIGVTVLCPSFVRTKIGNSARNRQGRYGSQPAPEPGSAAAARAAQMQEMVQAGIEPSTIAAHVVAGIRANELYVLTHLDWNWEVEERLAAIQDAMKRVATRLS